MLSHHFQTFSEEWGQCRLNLKQFGVSFQNHDKKQHFGAIFNKNAILTPFACTLGQFNTNFFIKTKLTAI